MRTVTEIGRLSPLGFAFALLVGCNAVIAGNASGGPTGGGGSNSAGGTSMGGSIVAPNDVPTQAIGALTCDVRYAPDGRVWRLSPEQYAAAVADSFAMNVDISAMPKDGINQSTGFSTGSSDNYVTVGFADVVWDAGKLAAESKAAQLQTQMPCLSSAPDAACIASVVTQVAGRAFRRPLPDAETQRYVQFFQTQSKVNGEGAALRMLLQAIANSPELLYRTELGSGAPGNVQLLDHELAAQLSFMLTDAPPSDALRAAADAAQLSDRATVAKLAKDLLATPAAHKKGDQFVSQYLQLSGLDSKVTDAAVADAMTASTQAFFSNLAFDSRGTFTDLMTAPSAYVNAALAPLYGVAASGTQLMRVELDPTKRGGLLTQLGFLAAKPGPIHRGRLIKEGFLCGDIPAPPPGASLQKDKLAGPDPDATEQQRWQNFKSQQPCGGCHTMFQPLGLGFDHYDEMGRYRDTNAAGRSIDASGAIVGTSDADGSFVDGLELGKKISASATGRYCFAKRYLSFAFGRDVTTGRDACAIKGVGDRMIQNGLVLSELFVAMTQDDSFYQRNNVE